MKAFSFLSALILFSSAYLTLSQPAPNDPGFLIGEWVWHNTYECGYDIPVQIFNSGNQNRLVLQANNYAPCLNDYIYPLWLPWYTNTSQNDLQSRTNQWIYYSTPSSVGQQEVYVYSIDPLNLSFQVIFANGYQTSVTLHRNSTNNGTNQTACNFTVGYTNYNLCPLSSNGSSPNFEVTDPLYGQLFFSVAQNASSTATSSNNSHAWATYMDDARLSYLIANQPPTYDLLTSWNPTQGLQLTFNVTQSYGRNFQLTVNLTCDVNVVTAAQTVFKMSLTTNSTTDTEAFSVAGSSMYACPTYMYTQPDLTPGSDVVDQAICGSIANVSSSFFNVCPLNQAGMFNSSDILGGQISFSLSTHPMARCGSGQNVWAVHYDNVYSCFEVAIKNPTFSLIDSANPNQGLKITYPVKYPDSGKDSRSFQLIVNLVCDRTIVDPSAVKFVTDVSAVSQYNSVEFTVTGSSIYGCPMNYISVYY